MCMAYTFQAPNNNHSNNQFSSRRSFFKSAALPLLTASVAMATPALVLADDADTFEDNLAMPSLSEEELKKQQEAELAERLRLKRELQKKKSRPMDFKESMKREKEMQGSLKMSKEETRDAMCEELGRGC